MTGHVTHVTHVYVMYTVHTLHGTRILLLITETVTIIVCVFTDFHCCAALTVQPQ